LILQTGFHLILQAVGMEKVPPGVIILMSIFLFQGLLTLMLFWRMHHAKLDVPLALGLESPFGVRELVGGLVGYCMALPVVAVAALITTALFAFFHLEIQPQPLLEEFSSTAGWMNWVTLFLLIGFIGPMLEEVIFRGFLFAWLRQRWGIQAGLWLQALVFALIHQYAAGLLPLFALSVVLGLAYVYTQRLMVCVWIHSIFNTVTLLNVILGVEGMT
jgi:membrane protease YdiL (CAAX protease family)